MIIRQLCRRQGRALFGAVRPSFQSRYHSTETETVAQISQSTDPIQAVQPKALAEEQPALSEQFRNLTARRVRFNELGSQVKSAYEPENLLRNPPGPSDITLELLLASQSHLGHATSLWNPRNSSYIFGIRDGIHIISLEVTAAYLRRAAKVVEEVARRGGLILFVGTRKGQRRAVVRAAELAQGYHVFERWVPGSITNGQQILGHCELKVVDEFDNELPRYKENVSEQPVLRPDLVVCLNPIENEPLLTECRAYNIPTIGIIDTDADALMVTYPIPANDDSLRSVAVIAGVLGRAGEAGQKARLQQSRTGKLPYERVSMKKLMPDSEGSS
ncbi:37S ribosomal protein, mitochondrial [Coccidioides posadasii str. Silveira]|uniref:40S ribosomal protein S2 n=2 Tax=Coccidioides posadasii TaxID=199306 RepID=E9CZL3_COCPS|nr:40S ribosomal protein S2 [Coccidioides posadasii str. Silveira]KMM73317.1 37S ribosomal protein MRP4 [Coccidioides posadasii RMSCC 3488]QVM08758.1 37S ribosomal protein, mitochondrial [Coccidioides posadasii str. Silveira]